MAKLYDSQILARWVHRILLLGVVLSGLLLVVGLSTALLTNELKAGENHQPPPTRDVLRLAFAGSGVAMMYLGLLALMATPVLRVVVLAIGWAAEREWQFAAVALAVLALLGLSLALGLG